MGASRDFLFARSGGRMDLYRYLFAPVLLLVAVWLGHHERRPIRPPEPPAVEAVHQRAQPAAQPPTALSGTAPNTGAPGEGTAR